MAIIEASAPGKLFLLGEYAVLDGAPALLTAVDRRVTVTVAPSDDDRWHLSTPGLDLDALTLEADGSIPAGLDGRTHTQLRVFDAVRTVVRCTGALSITIDSTAFFAAGHKLGLGSSAAVATALTAALSIAAGRSPSREEIRILATEAHRSAQRGTGSGGDVASSSYGGLIGYVRDTAPTSLVWPQELEIMAVVTGTGSSTTDLVGKVADYAARDTAQYRADIERLAALADQAQDAVHSAEDFLRLASDYFSALVELDAHAGAGIVSEHHLRLHSLAADLGGVFKTSGAGGGDVGLVFGRRGESTAQLTEAFAEAGAEAVPLGFGANGVTITPSTATATLRMRDGSTS
ncbi:phosphomevalonate kinase [Rhodoglobus aureus]|uniref:Phosphomevalonate kinase n=1 Tax=Rhodoglobus aureus TaxID=191497 RepID=A0ABN1VT43_9MICO